MLNEFICLKKGRLDQILSEQLQISRNQIATLIKSKSVTVNEKMIDKPSFIININDYIKYRFLTAKQSQESNHSVNFDIDILYEDNDILVLNKPSNLTIHQAPSVKEPTLVDWLKSKNYTLSTINGEIRSGIVHRLDKYTTGAIVVAKNNDAHAKLSAQLVDKSMGRIYLAITDLSLKENILIDKPLARSDQNRLKKVVVPKTKTGAKNAKSAFANILTKAENSTKANLIAAKLFTGRTHQIRAHLASINRHILGDNLYGFKSKNDKIPRVMLHAYILNLLHPKTGKAMKFVAPLFDDFIEILYKNFVKEIVDEKINPEFIGTVFDGADGWMCLKNSE